jgi:hypothetical protein
MTSISCTGPVQSETESLDLGRHCEEDSKFVGRTGVAASGRALVPTAPSPLHEPALASRPPSAGFLAQLIATAQQAPQTRARRRAEPDHASAVYDAAVARCIDAGGTVCRAMWA